MVVHPTPLPVSNGRLTACSFTETQSREAAGRRQRRRQAQRLHLAKFSPSRHLAMAGLAHLCHTRCRCACGNVLPERELGRLARHGDALREPVQIPEGERYSANPPK